MSDENNPNIIHFEEDISEQEAPPVLPEGIYDAEIIKSEVKTKADKSGSYINVHYRVGKESFPPDFETSEESITVIGYAVSLVNDAKNRFALKTFCQKIGAPVPKKELDMTDWVGRTVQLDLIQQEYPVDSGQMQVSIKRIVGAV